MRGAIYVRKLSASTRHCDAVGGFTTLSDRDPTSLPALSWSR
jgi:hypothetical protein